MSTESRITKKRSATAILAVVVLALASLHGLIPHHGSTGVCHECETLASPALLPAPEMVARPEAPAVVLARRGESRPAQQQARRLRPTRAPPSPAVA